MKKLLLTLTTFTLFLSFSLANATVHGILLDENREGVPDHPIELTFYTSNSHSMTFDLLTDSLGRFSQGIPRGFEGGGAILFRYENCNGDTVEVRRVLPPVLPPNRVFHLKYCKEDNEGQDCAVKVQRRPSNSGDVHLTAMARGKHPFQFEWSNGDTTRHTVVPKNSNWCVTMTDAAGCSDTTCFEAIDSCLVNIQRLPSNPAHPELRLAANYRPMHSSVDYSWNTGDSTRVIVIDTPGTYCVTATNAEGCTASSCITVPERDSACIEAEIVVRRDSTGNFAVLSVRHDPNLDLQYRWNTGDTSRVIRVHRSGMYVVHIFNPEDSCVVVKRTFVKLNECKVKIVARPSHLGYRLIAITPGPPNQHVEFEWSTGETGRSILIRHPNQRYCVTAIFPNCEARDCFVPRKRRNPGNIGIRKWGLADNGDIQLKADAPEGYAILWEDGTEGPLLNAKAPGTYTAYGIGPDGEQTHSSYRLAPEDLQTEPEGDLTPELDIFPNPAQHALWLRFDELPGSDASVFIYNMSGSVQKEVPSQQLPAQGPIDISDLRPGMYLLEVRTAETVTTQKFVVN